MLHYSNRKWKKSHSDSDRLREAETSFRLFAKRMRGKLSLSIYIICQIDFRNERQLDDLSQVKSEWKASEWHWHIS